MRAWLPNCTRSQSLQLGCKKKTWTLKLQPLQDTQTKDIPDLPPLYVSPIITWRVPVPKGSQAWTCQRRITTCFRPSLSLEKSLEPLHCSVQSHAVMLRPWHGHHDPRDTAHRGTPSHQQRWRPSQRSKILKSKSCTEIDRLYQFRLYWDFFHSYFLVHRLALAGWLFMVLSTARKICTISTSANIFPPALPVPRTCHRPW